jgi:pyruvate carboxylase subunit B
MCQLKAIESGCQYIDTALSPFSGGTSHPPTESMVAALKGTGYDTELDLPLLQEIGIYFYAVRKKYRRFESEFTGVDTRVQVNQIPGGMISNLANQLREQGALEKMRDVLREIPRVREDLGYPPLVTPTSQIVGTQAVLNVLTGARYKNITNEVKFYLQGRYGNAPGTVNGVVRQQAIGNEEVITVRPADLLRPELESLREEVGALAQSDKDVLTYAMFPEIGREFLEQRQRGELKPEPLEPPPSEETDVRAVPTEFNVTMHGETYHIQITGAGHKSKLKRPFYVTVDGVPEEIDVEVLEELFAESARAGGAAPAGGSQRPRATAPGHVTTSMPGTVVEVLVKVGDTVEAGTPVLVTEAMKMESEIQAPVAGEVKAVNVEKGDRVNPDEALIEIG